MSGISAPACFSEQEAAAKHIKAAYSSNGILLLIFYLLSRMRGVD
jgi:hypothetical protein